MNEFIDIALSVLSIAGTIAVFIMVIDILFIHPYRLRQKYLEGFQDGVEFATAMHEDLESRFNRD